MIGGSILLALLYKLVWQVCQILSICCLCCVPLLAFWRYPGVCTPHPRYTRSTDSPSKTKLVGKKKQTGPWATRSLGWSFMHVRIARYSMEPLKCKYVFVLVCRVTYCNGIECHWIPGDCDYLVRTAEPDGTRWGREDVHLTWSTRGKLREYSIGILGKYFEPLSESENFFFLSSCHFSNTSFFV